MDLGFRFGCGCFAGKLFWALRSRLDLREVPAGAWFCGKLRVRLRLLSRCLLLEPYGALQTPPDPAQS